MLYLVQSITLRELIKLVPFVSGISYHKFEVQDTKGCNIMEKEIWKPVVGYEGIYEVSSFGRIKSLARTITMKVRLKEKMLKTAKIIKHGSLPYRLALLSKNDERKTVQVHRIVAQAFIPNPENKPVVNHKDSDGANNIVGNLEWVTYRENTLHSYSKPFISPGGSGKRMYRGENSPWAKLSNQQVQEIKELRGKITPKKIAEKYLVSVANVYSILNGRTRRFK